MAYRETLGENVTAIRDRIIEDAQGQSMMEHYRLDDGTVPAKILRQLYPNPLVDLSLPERERVIFV